MQAGLVESRVSDQRVWWRCGLCCVLLGCAKGSGWGAVLGVRGCVCVREAGCVCEGGGVGGSVGSWIGSWIGSWRARERGEVGGGDGGV